MKQTDKTLLTTEEFAERVGMKPATIRAWVFYRKVPFVKIGRSVRFRPETAEEILVAGQVDANPEFALA